jgi:hypothetical protein
MAVYVSQQYTVTCQFEDANSTLADPSVVLFTKEAPDSTTVAVLQAALTHVGTGVWSYTTSETTPGTYTWEGKGTGTVTARDLVRVRVVPGIT